MLKKAKDFFMANETRIILLFGLILIAGVSFEAGYLKGSSSPDSPVIIEKLAGSPENAPEGQSKNIQEVYSEITETIATGQNSEPEKKACVYVGSKNSNKYHVPTCRFAKLIKPENIVCFSSAEDATSKGYLPDKGCIR